MHGVSRDEGEKMAYTDEIFSAVEKVNFLDRLTDELQSTRFMSVKFLSMSISNHKLNVESLAAHDPLFFEDLCRTIGEIANDANELDLIKKEASIVLENLKPYLQEHEPLYNVHNLSGEVKDTENAGLKKVCKACNAFCDVSWSYCPMCGAKLD